MWDHWTELSREGSEADLLRSLRHHQTFDYVLLLLRYHRPGFDALPLEERATLLADSCAHLNESLEGLKKFMAFVEYGTPGRGAVPVARDVNAAILKDVEGLTTSRSASGSAFHLPSNLRNV